jgi:hypothetical protein
MVGGSRKNEVRIEQVCSEVGNEHIPEWLEIGADAHPEHRKTVQAQADRGIVHDADV